MTGTPRAGAPYLAGAGPHSALPLRCESPQPRCIALPPRVGIMAMMNAEERDAARAEAHQKRKVLTEYMKHERDPNVGEFENERDFQEKVERLRIYVKPEYDLAVDHYEQQMLEKRPSCALPLAYQDGCNQ